MSLVPVISPPLDPGANVIEFLERLGGPCCIHIPGDDSSRCRFVVTLQHGNEPSGTYATYQLLKEQWRPVCDIYIAIMNVKAALTEPVFSNRQLPERRDLNRCYKAPFDDEEGQLAKELLALIAEKQPEALIDIHNTSGMGPAFGVAVHLDSKHDALVSCFTERLIITDIRIGALMELSEQDVPTVTVECGGAQAVESHHLAAAGLHNYISKQDLFNLNDAPWPIEILHNPIRLELSATLDFLYGDPLRDNAELIIRSDIEHFNFGVTTPDTVLGWIDNNNLQKLIIRSSAGNEPLAEWFHVINGELRPVRPLKLFMITSQSAIARSDCLLYAVRCREPNGKS